MIRALSRPAGTVELADIIRTHGEEFFSRHATSTAQRRVLRDLTRCRTASLGGHVERCDRCPHSRIAYNSCRNRHCPKCQGSAAAQWMQDRVAELLDVPYFHVVFTLPAALAPVALQNPRLVYGLLFRAVARTLLEVAANPQHLGAKLGFLAVLHTWGQNLHHHPHLHCVVPAGGLSSCGKKWIAGAADYFLPVRVLSRVFRGKFLELLHGAYAAGRLHFHGQLARLREPGAWQHQLNVAVRREWVVYAKPPFGGPDVVLKYLSRYTHRVAISNRRLLRLQEGQVTFRYKDYAEGNRSRTLTLSAAEFLRRFGQHVLPKGFQRIRYFGWMANRDRRQKLARCRNLLSMTSSEPASGQPPTAASADTGEPQHSGEKACPVCQHGRLHTTRLLPPEQWSLRDRFRSSSSGLYCDSS
jgi:hypothetical protein